MSTPVLLLCEAREETRAIREFLHKELPLKKSLEDLLRSQHDFEVYGEMFTSLDGSGRRFPTYEQCAPP